MTEKLATLALALLAIGSPALAAATEAAFDALFERYWQYSLQRDPTNATYLGDHRWGAELRDYSGAAEDRHIEALREFLAEADAIDRSGLEDSSRLSALIFERLLSEEIEVHAFRRYETPLTQQSGLHIGFPQLISYHPFDTAAHCRDFIARLHLFPGRVDQIIANMRTGIERGNVPYRHTIELVLPQVEALGTGDPSEHPLAGAIGEIGAAVSVGDREQIEAAILLEIQNSVMPAYRLLHAFLETEYLPACRTTPGIHALPRGPELYSFLARRYTTTDLTPEEIHAIGLAEMERIRAEMEEIVRRVEFRGDLDAFFAYLRDDPSFYHDSAEALIEGFREILVVMDAKLPELFGRLPETPYDLKEMEAYRAASAPAAYYYGPPDDGSRPGYFYVNTYDLPSRPRYTMEALAYHEAVPGHHLQIALARELPELPEFRRHQGFTAFVEGWGLYSEGLPKEVGLYADPYSDFGRLTFDAWRASRLVVDTGIHALGWSRDDAIEYLSGTTALARHDIESEVDRYIGWPGQALSYKIGQLRISELRAEAEGRLGERFDRRAFHDAVLRNGAVPLDVLEAEIQAWIVDSAGAP